MQTEVDQEFMGINLCPYYGGNGLYCQEVRFFVPGGEWSEFERSPLYRMIAEYADGVEMRYKPSALPESECLSESGLSPQISETQPHREAFWVRVRTLLHRRT